MKHALLYRLHLAIMQLYNIPSGNLYSDYIYRTRSHTPSDHELHMHIAIGLNYRVHLYSNSTSVVVCN